MIFKCFFHDMVMVFVCILFVRKAIVQLPASRGGLREAYWIGFTLGELASEFPEYSSGSASERSECFAY